MAIILHCESCGAKIKAPDEGGGKYGRCPNCNHRNYIPAARIGDEPELKLAPIDPNEETRYARLMEETSELTRQILDENEPLDEDSTQNEAEKSGGISERVLLRQIVIYLVQTAHGQLEAAERTFGTIEPYENKACELLENMKRASQVEAELADISPHVLKGLMDDLKGKL